jgi:hypothetical protein
VMRGCGGVNSVVVFRNYSSLVVTSVKNTY